MERILEGSYQSLEDFVHSKRHVFNMRIGVRNGFYLKKIDFLGNIHKDSLKIPLILAIRTGGNA